MTVCKKCNLDKGDDFRGYNKACRDCQNAEQRERTKALKDKTKPEFIICVKCDKKTSDFEINNKKCNDCKREEGRDYRRNNREKSKAWIENNRERMAELNRNWYRQKRDESPLFRECMNHRSNLSRMVSGHTKNSAKINCNSNRLQDWIAYQFGDKMEFENYPKYWNIDHLIPINKVLSGNQPKEVVFHWLNIRPLDVSENARKHKDLTKSECRNHLKISREFLKSRNLLGLANEKEYFKALRKYCDTLPDIGLRGRPEKKAKSKGKNSEEKKITEESSDDREQIVVPFSSVIYLDKYGLPIPNDDWDWNLYVQLSLQSSDTTPPSKGSGGTRLIAVPKGKKSEDN